MKHVNAIKGGVGFATACAVAAIGVAIGLAPTAGASTDPDLPYGATPTTSTAPTYHVDDQDEVDTSGGFVDRPF
ncbi:hypothetical protein [Mycobacterium sp. AT1]|uniref:hypothetical protein n=1 Tax=Mycobacterium sp. AT1 TaxID=1961706 RepID=UPI0009AD6020|nr:hypothetical protein [Mycobacterium sp. AT1]OPX08424.1 hypothetical protein B1790_19380 [Mycobacterium sp. AT1]